MEAIAVEEIAEPVARTATARSMFKYSSFVDVGEGAEQCEHARDGQCDDPEHFHAWCRLPNNYQHEDIRKKGLAAKARSLRALRDPESDLSVVVDSKLAELNDEIFRDVLIDELVSSEWAEAYVEAQRDVEEMDEFEHIAQDREEFARLSAEEGELPEDQQSDEFTRLRKHMRHYLDSVRAKTEERQDPKRGELRERTLEALLGLVRARRVEQEADLAFSTTYDAWTWFAGTYRVELHQSLRRPTVPMWEEIGRPERGAAGTMFGEPPEVIEALRSTYLELRVALHRGSTEGN